MHAAVKDSFVTAEANEFNDVKYDYVEEIDGDHGRIEIRRYWITDDINTLPQKNKWKGLRIIGMVERICEINGKITVERRFFICSIPANAKIFARAVRGNWGIENALHWRMDVVFKEDESRIRKGFAPSSFITVTFIARTFKRTTFRIQNKMLQADHSIYWIY